MLRVQGDSLKILEPVRAYSVPIRDRRASELVTWYVEAPQRAVDMIWDSIEWGYRFAVLVRRGGNLITIMGLKMMIPIIP
ncbi:MAG: hypothetical protein RQ885_01490 [Desulfurococcales archaeon]|jgi:putative transposase|nr:hypothetical protein [Desulfurococcales archaeon]